MSVNISCDDAAILGGRVWWLQKLKVCGCFLESKTRETAYAIPVNLKHEIRVRIFVFVCKAGLSWG